MAVLSCVALSAACAGDTTQGDLPGNTEVNLVISDPDTPPEELLLLIDFVSYRITCLNNPDLTLYDDSVDLAGNFEVDAAADGPPVWQLVTSLPLTECYISLWVFYEDEVICSGGQLLQIYEDGNPLTPNKADIVLECYLSVIPPSGDADIDGSFDFVHGNYCPQIFWLGSYPSPDPLVMNVQTRSIDVDNGCGQNCDPQTCDFTNPPVCTPAPDPGMITSTFIAPAGNGTFGDANALDTTYACDPLLPGPTEICAMASDGDYDCDRMLCMTIVCPDLCDPNPCVDDFNDCTRERCDPMTGQCIIEMAPEGIACADCSGTCDTMGACSGPPWSGLVSGTSMNFVGTAPTTPLIDITLTNAYSGLSVQLTGQFNVNQSSYEGIGIDDVLVGTNLGDFLLLYDPPDGQRLCGVERIIAQNNFDAIILDDHFIKLNDIVIEGGNAKDWLVGNVGNDTLRGNNGVDLLDGGPGNNIIEGGGGNDTITISPGKGFASFDSISGGIDTDRVEINAIQSQILITRADQMAADPYEFDIWYLGTPIAQIREVELLDMIDASIDLTTCTGPDSDVCNLCGNDDLNGGEGCDDGNNVSGDGCAADCTSEY